MASIQGIYLALFGRPADPAGLAYFNKVTNNGSDLSKIGDLADTAEYKSRFAGKSNDEIVNSIYKSLFGRDAEPEGLAFFSNGLKNGTFTINTIAISILDGAQGSDKTTIDGKVVAANFFTTHLDLAIEIAAYQGNAAAQVGRDYISSITSANPGTGENADAAILKLLALAGQAPAEGGNSGGSSSGPPPITDEGSYSGDVLILKDSAPVKSYTYSDATPKAVFATVQTALNESGAFTDKPTGDTLLVNNLDPINKAYGEQIGALASIPGNLIESYKNGWLPNAFFFGIPGQSSTVLGTQGNDVALIVDGSQFDHKLTGGRGNDVLVVAGIDGYVVSPTIQKQTLPVMDLPPGPAVPMGPIPAPVGIDPPNPSDAFSGADTQPAKVGIHVIDGGAGDDIVINIGGDNNVLTGGDGQDLIVSLGSGRDKIDGGAGDDFIFGGSDQGMWRKYIPMVAASETPPLPFFAKPDFDKGDILTGGAGHDTFLYLPEGQIRAGDFKGIPGLGGDLFSNGADTITDFKTTEDKIKIFVNDDIGINYNDGSGFKDFDEASTAAVKSFLPEQQKMAGGGINAFFAAGVDNGGYLFIDDNGDARIDFVIKLNGLTDVSKFSAADIDTLYVNFDSIVKTVGSVLTNPSALPIDT